MNSKKYNNKNFIVINIKRNFIKKKYMVVTFCGEIINK